MSFVVLIPARMKSTRLPDKPLADLGGLPMVVRVAQQAARSGASTVCVACDDLRILQACEAAGVQALLTRADHPSGSDRLAEACNLLGLSDDTIVVNVQGDEPLIDPELINAVARSLAARQDTPMSTAAHPVHDEADFVNPNVVKVVLDAAGRAMYFSRSPLPFWRDGGLPPRLSAETPALRHIGIYAYRSGFLRNFPSLAASPLERTESLEQLRVLWHGHRIAVHVTSQAPGTGVDTPEDLARVRLHF